MSGRQAGVQVIADGRNSNTAGTAMGYVNTIVEHIQRGLAIAAHNQGDPPVRLTTRAWYNPNLETRWHMIPALIGMLTLLETMLLTALSVAREREQGTFDQLLVTPFRPAEIMVGQGVAARCSSASSRRRWSCSWRSSGSGSRSPDRFLRSTSGSAFVRARRHRHRPAALVGGGDHAAGDALSRSVIMMPFALLSGLTTPIAACRSCCSISL